MVVTIELVVTVNVLLVLSNDKIAGKAEPLV
jgi:hypothetical protein